jgi:hypothetical protein
VARRLPQLYLDSQHLGRVGRCATKCSHREMS